MDGMDERSSGCEARGTELRCRTAERGCTRRDRLLKTAELMEGANCEGMALRCNQANNDIAGGSEREGARM